MSVGGKKEKGGDEGYTHRTSERPYVQLGIDFTPCEGFRWLNVFRCVEGCGGCLAS